MFLRAATQRELLSLAEAFGLQVPLDLSPIKKRDTSEEMLRRKIFHKQVCLGYICWEAPNV